MTQVYSTAVTPWFIAAQQAAAAGGSVVNLAGGTVNCGNGSASAPGTVPLLSAILANGGVLNQVWSGPVNSVSVDASNTAQIDVGVLIPTLNSSGVEIGPFTVTEFAIYEAGGNLCIYGNTNLPKAHSALGMPTSLLFYACYVESAASAVTVTPPPGSFPTLGQIQSGVAGLLSATPPLAVTPTLQSSGWTDWNISLGELFLPLAGGTMTGTLKAPAGLVTELFGVSSAVTLTAAESGQFIEVAGGTTFTVTLPAAANGLRYTGISTGANGFTISAGSASISINNTWGPTFFLPYGTYFDVWSDGTNWLGFACGPGIFSNNLTAIAQSYVTTSGIVTVPPGATGADVEVYGGGGGSGGVGSAGSGAGSGGGGAGSAFKRLSGLTPGQTLTAVIGAGGAAGGAGGNGGAGGATSLAGSGFATITANGGNGGSHNGAGLGGAGGTAGGGDYNITGGYGGAAYPTGGCAGGQGGGCSGGGAGGSGAAGLGSGGSFPGGGAGGSGATGAGPGNSGAGGMIIILWR